MLSFSYVVYFHSMWSNIYGEATEWNRQQYARCTDTQLLRLWSYLFSNFPRSLCCQRSLIITAPSIPEVKCEQIAPHDTVQLRTNNLEVKSDIMSLFSLVG